MEQARQLFLAALEHIEQEHHAKAEPLLREALRLSPGRVSILLNLSACLIAQEKYAEALPICVAARAAQDENPTAWLNLGLCQLAQNDGQEALSSLNRACDLAPHDPHTFANRSSALVQLQRNDEALRDIDHAMSLDPDDAEFLTARGFILRSLGRLEEARETYEAALKKDGNSVTAHWNKSFVDLSLGDYAVGLEEFEWRWRDSRFAAQHPMPASPQWQGEADIRDRTVLLIAEQGLGDTLQFCRYASALAALGARMIVQTQRPLVELLHSLQGIKQILPLGEQVPPHDFHCPLLSIPLALKTREESIPAATPYLFPDPLRLAVWRARVSTRRKLVGLVWKGNQDNRSALYRSLPATALDALTTQDCDFISLQLQGDEADRAWLRARGIRDWSGNISNFSDTAALVSCCDLVITVDTSVAHLAGALNKPVWIMLSVGADWRWGLAEHSRWYPSARLFRQDRAGNWAHVAAQVNESLSRFLQGDATNLAV